MGCDIHTCVEVKSGDKWELVAEDWMDGRSYSIFGFLADVRNYSRVTPISDRKGLPEDMSKGTRESFGDGIDWHSSSWLTLAELLAPNYDEVFWDRRVTKQTGPNSWTGAGLAEEGEGEHLTLREFLGEWYFKEVDKLRQYGEAEKVRVVFWFDN